VDIVLDKERKESVKKNWTHNSGQKVQRQNTVSGVILENLQDQPNRLTA
jgi:hypothetical protein